MSENTQTTQKPTCESYWDKTHKIRGLHDKVRIYRSPKREAKEWVEQTDFVSWLRLNYSELSDACYHVANESNSTANYRSKLSKMGLSSGIPDIMFIGIPLVIEMKQSAQGSLSKEQKHKLNLASMAGWFSCVCFGAEAAKLAIKDYIEWSSDV